MPTLTWPFCTMSSVSWIFVGRLTKAPALSAAAPNALRAMRAMLFLFAVAVAAFLASRIIFPREIAEAKQEREEAAEAGGSAVPDVTEEIDVHPAVRADGHDLDLHPAVDADALTEETEEEEHE